MDCCKATKEVIFCGKDHSECRLITVSICSLRDLAEATDTCCSNWIIKNASLWLWIDFLCCFIDYI